MDVELREGELSLTLTGLREQFALDERRGNSEERSEYPESKAGRQ